MKIMKNILIQKQIIMKTTLAKMKCIKKFNTKSKLNYINFLIRKKIYFKNKI